jgi:hypothetical protein
VTFLEDAAGRFIGTTKPAHAQRRDWSETGTIVLEIDFAPTFVGTYRIAA